MEDVGGSMTKGYGGCCDSGSNKNGVTPIKTRLLRKGQSSRFDTMLEILNAIVKKCTWELLYKRHICVVQACVIQVI